MAGASADRELGHLDLSSQLDMGEDLIEPRIAGELASLREPGGDLLQFGHGNTPGQDGGLQPIQGVQQVVATANRPAPPFGGVTLPLQRQDCIDGG